MTKIECVVCDQIKNNAIKQQNHHVSWLEPHSSTMPNEIQVGCKMLLKIKASRLLPVIIVEARRDQPRCFVKYYFDTRNKPKVWEVSLNQLMETN